MFDPLSSGSIFLLKNKPAVIWRASTGRTGTIPISGKQISWGPPFGCAGHRQADCVVTCRRKRELSDNIAGCMVNYFIEIPMK